MTTTFLLTHVVCWQPWTQDGSWRLRQQGESGIINENNELYGFRSAFNSVDIWSMSESLCKMNYYTTATNFSYKALVARLFMPGCCRPFRIRFWMMLVTGMQYHVWKLYQWNQEFHGWFQSFRTANPPKMVENTISHSLTTNIFKNSWIHS